MGQTFFKQSIWSLLAALCARASAPITLLIADQWLDKEQFGELALVQATLLTFSAVIGLGCGVAATTLVAKGLATDKTRVGIDLVALCSIVGGLAFLCSVCVFASRHSLADWLLNRSEASSYFAVGSLLLSTNAITLFQLGVLAGFRAFRVSAIASGASGLLTVIAMAIGLSSAETLGAIWGLFVASLLSSFLFGACILRALRTEKIKLSLVGLRRQRSVLSRAAAPAIMLNSVNAPTDCIGFALLARQPGGIVEMGIYYALNQWCLLLRFIPMAVGAVITPTLSAATGVERRRLQQRVLRNGVLLTAAASCLVVAGLMFCSDWLLALYGTQFVGRHSVLACLLAAGVAISAQIIAERTLLGMGHFWLAFGLSAARGISFCFLSIAFVQGGADGLAVARTVTFVLHALASVAIGLIVSRKRFATQNLQPSDSLPNRDEKIRHAA